MSRTRSNAQPPIAITSVPLSLDDQHDARRRKYLIMMGIRVLCVLAAVATAPASLWLALIFICGGAVLPWCAVLIANDRPPRHGSTFVRFRPPPPARHLPPGLSPSASPDSADGRSWPTPPTGGPSAG